MLKNLTSKTLAVAFVLSIVSAPISALAIEKPAQANTINLTVAEKSTDAAGEHEQAMQSTGATYRDEALLGEVGGSSSPPATGWILAMALLGFVLLSNRMGV